MEVHIKAGYLGKSILKRWMKRKQRRKRGMLARNGWMAFNVKMDDLILCNAFSMLEWNIMARSDNVTSCHLNHIEWRNDILVIFLLTQKVTRRV